MRHILLLTCCLVVALPAFAASSAVDVAPPPVVDAPAPAVEALELTEALPLSLAVPEPLFASAGVPLWCQQQCVGGTAYYLCAGTPKQCHCVCRYPV